jgi:excisionase family DNA binding protein
MSNEHEYWTVSELARRWAVSRSVVYKWISNDVLLAKRLGPKLFRIPMSAVIRFERENRAIVPSTNEIRRRVG